MDYKDKMKRNRLIRLVVLIAVLAISTVLGLLHQFSTNGKPPGVDAFCPFGGLESLYVFITQGIILKRIAISSFVLLLAIVVIALLFRRAFCGNLCAFGALQELFARIGRAIFKRRFEIPGYIDKPARMLKYIVLFFIIGTTIWLGELFIRPYDPWVAYHHILSSELFTELFFGFIILFISLLGSLLFDRFFCKYICPMGAFLGIIGKIGQFKIERNSVNCIDCKGCSKACPVNIPVHESYIIETSECINCNECVNSCPVENTLEIVKTHKKGKVKKKTIKANTLLALSLILFIGVIVVATLTGGFEWKQSSFKEEIELNGSFESSVIKGRMTFMEISIATRISKESFIERFNISEKEFTLPIKEVHKNYNFSTEDVRRFVDRELRN